MSRDDELLCLYIRKKLDTTRQVRISTSMDEGEFRIRQHTIVLSHSFISPKTDLHGLASRIEQAERDFDTRQQEERKRTIRELESIIEARFSHLSKLSPSRALSLLQKIQDDCAL